MSFYHPPTRPAAPHRWRTQQLLRQFAQAPGLPFSGVLTAEQIQQQLQQYGADFAQQEGETWNAVITLWAFLSQCSSDNKTCSAAVFRVIGLLFSQGLPACSANTGAYCKARAKLPEGLLRELALSTAWKLEAQAPADWLWYGRNVFLIDGSTVSMPDTKENQQVYPQQRGQKPGLGFPLMRIVVAFSLATGALVAVAWAPYRGKGTGESSLLRKLLDNFREGDLFVGDQQFCSYWMVALARKRNLDVLFCQHHLRASQSNRQQRLGRCDHLAKWTPTPKPVWMGRPEYKAMRKACRADPLVMREITFTVNVPGFRSRQITVATSLRDARRYPQQELADLYRERWNVELDLRSLKCSMDMEPLRCKTPQMVHKEILAHFLAYNLIRKVLAQSALQEGRLPRHISFTAGRVALAENRAYLSLFAEGSYEDYCRYLLLQMAQYRVGHRPDRIEPRAKKRRPKPHRLLQLPRAEARLELLKL